MKIHAHMFYLYALLILSTTAGFGQPGSLDTSFGSGGTSTVITTTGLAASAVMQSDGKTVVLMSSHGVMELVRFDADGSPDTTFGGGDGIATFAMGVFPGPRYEEARAIALQMDGGVEKIIVAGLSYIQVRKTLETSLRVARYLPDGTLDNSFDNDGIFIGSGGWANGVAVQPDGKILTVGPNAVIRLNPDGGFDTSFGSGGKASTTNLVSGHALAVHSDGKIVAAGSHTLSGKGNRVRMTVVRYNGSGTLDTSFGSSGRTSIDFSGTDSRALTVAMDTSDRIVVGGDVLQVNSTYRDLAVARLNLNGQLDTSFSFDGKVTHDFSGFNEYGYGLAIQSDGKIVAGGQTDSITNLNTHFGMVRFDTAGNLDTSFGSGGEVVAEIFGDGNDWGRNILLQYDVDCSCEKIVMTGLARSPQEPFWHSAAARFFE